MSLRDDCIQAAAEAMRPQSMINSLLVDFYKRKAEAAFDAVLGVLSEHADEWDGELADAQYPTAEMWARAVVEYPVRIQLMRGLLAVLEGDQ